MKPGWGSGLIGVLLFSGSLPATRLAVTGFSPLFLTSARAIIAAMLGLALLLAMRQRRPGREQLGSLALTSAGVVLGFPLLTALALRHMTASRSIVFIGMLPLMTALFGVLRSGDRPRPAYWMVSGIGSVAVAGFARSKGGESCGT
ncbi:MAG: EamA family transporter, partial [Chloroflexota bacterium]